VTNVNSAGVSILQATTAANSALTGSVALGRDTFAGAVAGQILAMEGVVSGTGRLTVVDGGTVALNGANTFGSSVVGGSGSLIDGGTVIRSGTVEVGDSAGLGTKHVELGDIRIVKNTVIDRATTASLTLGGGTYNAAGGTAQTGAFVGVTATVDGNTYGVGDIGKTILVKNEEGDATRNGIYTIIAVNGGTMDLVRAADFDTPREMTYGTQFTVANGSSAIQVLLHDGARGRRLLPA
jgi:hypothetical protein